MKLTLQGQDITAALDAAQPLIIERKLNQPAICRFTLLLSGPSAPAVPARNQSVTVSGDDNTLYFTGYVATAPMPAYAGGALQGACYRYAVEAISDELLLDQLPATTSKSVGGQTAGTLMSSLVAHAGSTQIGTQSLTLASPVAHFAPAPGASFSTNAAQLAAQVRAAYRAHNGALTLSAIPAATHTFSEADGTLSLDHLSLHSSPTRQLANDITVCGQHETAAYITEYFLGDGATTQFNLSADPFFPPTAQAILISDQFDGPSIDFTRWSHSDASGYFAVNVGGLNFKCGNGIDGQTVLSWIDPVEMGGTLLLEASGLTLANASTGVLAAFSSGLAGITDCIAGFQARAQQGTGAVTLQPIVLGCASGSAYSLDPASQYTLRLRIHSPEQQRTQATYYAAGDQGLIATGGQSVLSAARLQFEIQPFVNGVAAMPVTLYDGTIASLPAACTVVAASSLNLQGSLRALRLTNLGSGWVVSTPSGSGAYTRRIGPSTQAAECQIERTGKLVFYSGFAPAAGEQVAISYRTIARAVGRAVNSASQQTSGPSAWIGTVTQPAPRSSADCRHAASALAQAAARPAALLTGIYNTTQLALSADIWPGDALQLTAPSAALDVQVVVRAVRLTCSASVPGLVHYEIAFANDWADDLAIKTSSTAPGDAWLPAPIASTPLSNLTALTVTDLSGSTVTVNTGTAPPTGGGFEVRGRDDCFQPGEDPDLLLRGSQQTLTFSRTSAHDRFYIRMYDGATPPNYSEFSAALFINLPLGS